MHQLLVQLRILLRKSKIFFCINVSKNTEEKLSSSFGVTKIKTDTTRACFPNRWYKDRVKGYHFRKIATVSHCRLVFYVIFLTFFLEHLMILSNVRHEHV